MDISTSASPSPTVQAPFVVYKKSIGAAQKTPEDPNNLTAMVSTLKDIVGEATTAIHAVKTNTRRGEHPRFYEAGDLGLKIYRLLENVENNRPWPPKTNLKEELTHLTAWLHANPNVGDRQKHTRKPASLKIPSTSDNFLKTYLQTRLHEAEAMEFFEWAEKKAAAASQFTTSPPSRSR